MKLFWLLAGRCRPAAKHTYMAASNLMSLHMRSQQGKGMPALLIPLYWPYVSAGFQCRGLHPERLKRQKQLNEKAVMRACLWLPKYIYLKNASCRLTVIAQLWNDQMLLSPFLHMNIYQHLPCYFYMRETKFNSAVHGGDGDAAGLVKTVNIFIPNYNRRK